MNYQQIKKQKEVMMNELFTSCKVFFAFSNEQFAENKTQLNEGEKYVSMGAGGYLPNSLVNQFSAGMKAIEQFGKDEVKKAKLEDVEILYELNNHECFYTNDCTDVFDLFEGKYTHDKILKVYRKNYETQTANL